MAYSMFEHPKIYNAKHTHYYPEEHDHYTTTRSIPRNNSDVNYPHPTSKFIAQKNSKIAQKTSSIKANFSETKCPIYVHHYPKIPTQQYTQFKRNMSKQSNSALTDTQVMRAHNFKNNPKMPKTVIDKLEESYWATWKPNKEVEKVDRSHHTKKINHGSINPKHKHRDMRSRKSNGDTLVEHYASNDFNVTSGTLSMSDYEKELLTERITSSQEIQTEKVENPPLILSKIDETTLNDNSFEEVNKQNSEETFTVNKSVLESLTEEEVNVSEMHSKENVTNTQNKSNEEEGEKETTNVLKHTDSFIINMKKQNVATEHYEQPKCIRLYRKTVPGIPTVSSVLKGGSYPLKSCLKKQDTSQKCSSKFGRPGSSLLVSSHFSKNKNKRK